MPKRPCVWIQKISRRKKFCNCSAAWPNPLPSNSVSVAPRLTSFQTARSPLNSRFRSPNQECAFLAEGAELGGIAKPPAFVFFGDRSGIGYAFLFHVGKSRRSKKRGPLGGGKQVRGNAQIFAPLMRMDIFAVIVDERPGRPAFAQDAVNFAQSRARIGPIVRGFHGNRVGEEVAVPGYRFLLAAHEHSRVDVQIAAAGAAD